MSVCKSDETLLSICILNFSFKNDFVWEEISNIRHSVSSPDETPRSSSKILRCASYFQLSSRCFIWWWNTASHVWYITWKSSFARTWKRSSRLFSRPDWPPLGLRGWVCEWTSIWHLLWLIVSVFSDIHDWKNLIIKNFVHYIISCCRERESLQSKQICLMCYIMESTLRVIIWGSCHELISRLIDKQRKR